MAQGRTDDARSGGIELEITRYFDAPRPLVFKAWTDPARLVRWLGPRGYPAVSCEIDPRPGGAWRVCLRSADGGPDLWQIGSFHEVVENERLVFSFAWRPPHSAQGHEMMVAVTFADRGAGTEMLFRQTGLPSVAERDGHVAGWNSSFDRLVEALAAGAP